MWNPPIALTPEEQKIVARTQKTRKFFVFLRERRHELLDADVAGHAGPEPTVRSLAAKSPWKRGCWPSPRCCRPTATSSDRDAVELTVMDKRWQMVLDCLGAEQPPFSQGTLFNFRMRLIAHNLDKTLLERTVALAEQTGGFGARQLRAALDSTPLFGAGRVEDTFNLLGHALRKAVGLAAQELDTSAEAIVADAGLTAGGAQQSQSGAGSRLGGTHARGSTRLGLVLEEVERWKSWLEQQHRLSAQEPPMQEMMETIAQIVSAGHRARPRGRTGRAAHQAARRAGPAHLYRGYRHAPRPQKQRQNLQRLQGALCRGFG